MSALAVVDLLNAVPPGAAVPEGGVLFAMPAAVVWLMALGLVAGGLVMAKRMARHALAWWRRLRRSAPPVAAETLAVPSA